MAKKAVILGVILTFLSGQFVAVPKAQAQSALNLPMPGTMVHLSPRFTPALIKGIHLNSDNPLQFDFIIDTGHSQLKDEALKKETEKLIKYFLASITIPEEDLWVNLSPYEKDRIIPDNFGKTEMGRDLLVQDYLLKQITASMIYPEDELGRQFWARVYKKAHDLYGTTEIPVDTFNKVWIVPQKAVIYQKGQSAYVSESYLKVMLEEDYQSLEHNSKPDSISFKSETDELRGISKNIIREIVIPELEREVNEGKNFARLRQIYHSLILATWFKRNLKKSFLGQVYADQSKTEGVHIDDVTVNNEIYEQYLDAFKKGVYNYIKEDYDPQTQEVIPRKYFSGGLKLKLNPDNVYQEMTDDSASPIGEDGNIVQAKVNLQANSESASPIEEDRWTESIRPDFPVKPEDVFIYYKQKGESILKDSANSIWRNVPITREEGIVLTSLSDEMEGVVLVTTNPKLNHNERTNHEEENVYVLTVNRALGALDIEKINSIVESVHTEYGEDQKYVEVISRKRRKTTIRIFIKDGFENQIFKRLASLEFKSDTITRTNYAAIALDNMNPGDSRRILWEELNDLVAVLGNEELSFKELEDNKQRVIIAEQVDRKITVDLLNDEDFIDDVFINIFARPDLHISHIQSKDLEYLGEGGFKRIYKVFLKTIEGEVFVFLMNVVKSDVVEADTANFYDEAYVNEIAKIINKVKTKYLHLYPAMTSVYVRPGLNGNKRLIHAERYVEFTKANLSEKDKDRMAIRTYLLFYLASGERFLMDPKPPNLKLQKILGKNILGTIIDLDNIFLHKTSSLQVLHALVHHGFRAVDIVEVIMETFGTEKGEEFLNLAAGIAGERYGLRELPQIYREYRDRPNKTYYEGEIVPETISIMLNGNPLFVPAETTIHDLVVDRAINLNRVNINLNRQSVLSDESDSLTLRQKRRILDIQLNDGATLDFVKKKNGDLEIESKQIPAENFLMKEKLQQVRYYEQLEELLNMFVDFDRSLNREQIVRDRRFRSFHHLFNNEIAAVARTLKGPLMRVFKNPLSLRNLDLFEKRFYRIEFSDQEIRSKYQRQLSEIYNRAIEVEQLYESQRDSAASPIDSEKETMRKSGRPPIVEGLLEKHKETIRGGSYTQVAKIIGVHLNSLSNVLKDKPDLIKKYDIRKRNRKRLDVEKQETPPVVTGRAKQIVEMLSGLNINNPNELDESASPVVSADDAIEVISRHLKNGSTVSVPDSHPLKNKVAEGEFLGELMYTPEQLQDFLELIGDKTEREKDNITILFDHDLKSFTVKIRDRLLTGLSIDENNRWEFIPFVQAIGKILAHNIENSIDAYLMKRHQNPEYADNLRIYFYLIDESMQFKLQIIANGEPLGETSTGDKVRTGVKLLGGYGQGSKIIYSATKKIDPTSQIYLMNRKDALGDEGGAIFELVINKNKIAASPIGNLDEPFILNIVYNGSSDHDQPVPRIQRFLAGTLYFATLLLQPFIMLAIKLDSKGSVYFTEDRVIGFADENIAIINNIKKFRSMREGTARGGVTDYDYRVTRVGKIIRLLKLDEIPQLWQVAKGEIPLFGLRPRPAPELLVEMDHDLFVEWQKINLEGAAEFGLFDTPKRVLIRFWLSSKNKPRDLHRLIPDIISYKDLHGTSTMTVAWNILKSLMGRKTLLDEVYQARLDQFLVNKVKPDLTNVLKDQPLVSVIVATYNMGNTIERAIQSVISQTYQNFEIIVVDDGSTDNTGEIVKQLSLLDHRIKYVPFKENKGKSAVLNKALDIFKGDYVVLLDADDALTKNSIRSRLQYLRQNPFLSFVYTSSVDQMENKVVNFKRVTPFQNSIELALKFLRGPTTPSHYMTFMYKREVFNGQNTLRYDEKAIRGEDLEMTMKIATAGHRSDALNDVTYVYTVDTRTALPRLKNRFLSVYTGLRTANKYIKNPIKKAYYYFRILSFFAAKLIFEIFSSRKEIVNNSVNSRVLEQLEQEKVSSPIQAPDYKDFPQQLRQEIDKIRIVMEQQEGDVPEYSMVFYDLPQLRYMYEAVVQVAQFFGIDDIEDRKKKRAKDPAAGLYDKGYLLIRELIEQNGNLELIEYDIPRLLRNGTLQPRLDKGLAKPGDYLLVQSRELRSWLEIKMEEELDDIIVESRRVLNGESDRKKRLGVVITNFMEAISHLEGMDLQMVDKSEIRSMMQQALKELDAPQIVDESLVDEVHEFLRTLEYTFSMDIVHDSLHDQFKERYRSYGKRILNGSFESFIDRFIVLLFRKLNIYEYIRYHIDGLGEEGDYFNPVKDLAEPLELEFDRQEMDIILHTMPNAIYDQEAKSWQKTERDAASPIDIIPTAEEKQTAINNLKSKWQTILAFADVEDEQGRVFEEIIKRYSEPHRYFHTVMHIHSLYTVFDELVKTGALDELLEETTDERFTALLLAIMLHDLIYNVVDGQDEDDSITLSKVMLQELGFNKAIIDYTAYLIELTKTHPKVPDDPLAQLFVDLDLSGFGLARQAFHRNTMQVQEEHKKYNYGQKEAIEKELAVLNMFAAHNFLYGNRTMREKYEDQAQRNLNLRIANLEVELLTSSPIGGKTKNANVSSAILSEKYWNRVANGRILLESLEIRKERLKDEARPFIGDRSPHTLREYGKKYGLSQTTVLNIFNKLGVIPKGRKITGAEERSIIAIGTLDTLMKLNANSHLNLTLTQIARKTGVKRFSVIKEHAQRYAVTFEPQTPLEKIVELFQENENGKINRTIKEIIQDANYTGSIKYIYNLKSKYNVETNPEKSAATLFFEEYQGKKSPYTIEEAALRTKKSIPYLRYRAKHLFDVTWPDDDTSASPIDEKRVIWGPGNLAEERQLGKDIIRWDDNDILNVGDDIINDRLKNRFELLSEEDVRSKYPNFGIYDDYDEYQVFKVYRHKDHNVEVVEKIVPSDIAVTILELAEHTKSDIVPVFIPHSERDKLDDEFADVKVYEINLEQFGYTTLSAYLTETQRSPKEAELLESIGRAILDSLRFEEGKAFIHRHMHSRNIMVLAGDEGEILDVKFIDFKYLIKQPYSSRGKYFSSRTHSMVYTAGGVPDYEVAAVEHLGRLMQDSTLRVVEEISASPVESELIQRLKRFRQISEKIDSEDLSSIVQKYSEFSIFGNPLLSSEFIAHDLAVYDLLRSDKNNQTAVYLASGSDILTTLYKFGSRNNYLVDMISGLKVNDFREYIELYWDRISLDPNSPDYLYRYNFRRKHGFFNYAQIEEPDDFYWHLISDLKSLGLEKEDVRVEEVKSDSGEEYIRITFIWLHPGEEKEREYSFTIIGDTNILDSTKYQQGTLLGDVLEKGIDWLYIHAGESIVRQYNYFLPVFGGALVEDGYFVSDDTTRLGENKFIATINAENGFTFSDPLNHQSELLKWAQNMITRYTENQGEYGWKANIRQKINIVSEEKNFADQSASPIEVPGGIDLNPNNMELETEGEAFDFFVPAELQHIDRTNINGFTPVIIQMIPLPSIQFFISETENKEEETLSFHYN